MTNEAMAYEIIQDSEYLKDDFEKAYFDCEMAEKMLMRMAEWKDRQFKEYLEKKKAECPSFGGLLGERASGYEDGYKNCIEQIINELFEE